MVYRRVTKDGRRPSDEALALNRLINQSISAGVAARMEARQTEEKRDRIKLDVRLELYRISPPFQTEYIEDVRVEAGIRRQRELLAESRAPIKNAVRGGGRRFANPDVLAEIVDIAMRLDGSYTKERGEELTRAYVTAASEGASGRESAERKIVEWTS